MSSFGKGNELKRMLMGFLCCGGFDVYGHATDRMKQACANRMDQLLEGLAK